MSCHLPVNETVIAKGRDIKISTGLKLEEAQHYTLLFCSFSFCVGKTKIAAISRS